MRSHHRQSFVVSSSAPDQSPRCSLTGQVIMLILESGTAQHKRITIQTYHYSASRLEGHSSLVTNYDTRQSNTNIRDSFKYF